MVGVYLMSPNTSTHSPLTVANKIKEPVRGRAVEEDEERKSEIDKQIES